MELQTKPDFEKCMARVEAWWDCQIIDRTPVTIYVKSDKPAHQVKSHHASLRDRWMDVDWNIDRVRAGVEDGVFLAENFPRYMPALGPEICSTAYGSELQFSENTTWSVPVAASIRDVLAMRPNLDNVYWNTIRRMTEQSLARGAGKWITAVTDMHTNGDLLASLRDPQNLCLDYMDDLEGVKLACEHVKPHMLTFFDDLWTNRIAPSGSPACCTWGCAPSRKTMYYVSCDFICMIGPEMFAQTILPLLRWECQQLGRSIYHLDGPGALRHLDALLEIPELDGVQWTYGAGAGPAARWIDVYKRIQAAGKCMEVHIADLDDARVFMDNLRPNGAWLLIGGSYSMEQANAFLKEVERWSAGKK